MGRMSESPEREGSKLLKLDEDVAKWLHEVADRDYSGDVGVAMNAALRGMMIARTNPDPWAGVTWLAKHKAQHCGRPLTEAELRQDRD